MTSSATCWRDLGRPVSALATSPASATFARLGRLDQYLAAEVGRPRGDGWYVLDAVVADGHLDTWFDELLAANRGRRDVAGSYLGSSLAGPVVTVTMSALVLERRVPDLGSGLWLHRHPDGWFDQVSLASAGLFVVADDGDAGHPASVVLDGLDALYDRCAEVLVEALSPPLWGVRQRASYGLRGLWGAVADRMCASAVKAARLVGSDGWSAWREAQAVLDQVAARQDHLRTRPSPLPVRWSGGEELFQVKGTCCLYYKTHDGELDACGDSYCTTCPFRDQDDRLLRLQAHLENSDQG